MATVEVLADSFYEAMNGLPRTVATRFGKRLLLIGRDFETTFIKRQLSGRPGLLRRTGTLARSMFVLVSGSGPKKVILSVGWQGKPAIVAWAHELGLTIKPRTKQFLAFPVKGGPADNPSGAMRPDMFSDLFFIKSKKDPQGTALLVRRVGAGTGRLEPIFILKRWVKLLDRLEFEKTFEHEQGDMMLDMQEEVNTIATEFNK